MLYSRNGDTDSRVIEGARVIDPAQGIDAALTVTVENGVITRLEPGSAKPGLMLAPAFVDPHVHLRTPGREDEETIASGTAAAAAGGYCAILAMPNTEPVVDSAAVLASLAEKARAEALVPVGFMAAISKGQEGAELTEMGELADAGAAAFTDDGRPVVSSGLMRRALQYSPVAGRRVAVHCEEPTLTRGGQMHEGVVSAELGFAGWPSVGESVMVERDLSIAAYEGQPLHLMHLSARESVEALSRAQAAGVQATGEVTPHHLCLTDEAVRSLDANVKMNPPLRSRRRPRCADRRAARRDDRLRRHGPRARMPGTRRTSRSRKRRSASPGSRPRSPRCTRTSSAPGSLTPRRRCSSACRPAPPARSGSSRRASRSARPRTSSCSTPRRPGG